MFIGDFCFARAQQELDYLNGEVVDPIVMDELHALRDHKMDLEDKLNGLQDSRRHLMGQLEGLMKLLKVVQKNTYAQTHVFSKKRTRSNESPIDPHNSKQTV